MEHIDTEEGEKDDIKPIPPLDKVGVGREEEAIGDRAHDNVCHENAEENVIGVAVENTAGVGAGVGYLHIFFFPRKKQRMVSKKEKRKKNSYPFLPEDYWASPKQGSQWR